MGAGGRVVDVEVAGEFPYHVFVAASSGGLWRSSNGGVTWEPLFDDQSTGTVGAVAVQPTNPDIIWVGTEHAAHVSIDRGARWVRLMNGLPTVPVADLVIHPRDGEIVAGNHRRSAYVMDISPLQVPW